MKPITESRAGSETGGASNWFSETRWSLVRRSADGHEGCRGAREDICRIYWYPLYAYVRRKGGNQEDAKDHVQGFLAQFCERDLFARATPSRGRMRGYLMTSLGNFLKNAHAHATALKRGGTLPLLSLDWDYAENLYRIEPADCETPEKLYTRAWALSLMEESLETLAALYAGRGQTRLFERLMPALEGALTPQVYEAAAAELGMSSQALRVAAHRLRERYRKVLKEQAAVALAITDEDLLEEELRSLLAP